jgi:hypothetical protein
METAASWRPSLREWLSGETRYLPISIEVLMQFFQGRDRLASAIGNGCCSVGRE